MLLISNSAALTALASFPMMLFISDLSTTITRTFRPVMKTNPA
jgi:hypothetical protein